METFFRKFDKTLIPTLPRFAYDGKIVIIQSVGEAEKAVDVLRRQPIVGIDTETRPTFRRGENHAVALLQAAGEDTCFLFRLNYIDIPECILSLMADTHVLKVGLSLGDDFTMMRRRNPEFHAAGFVDLQDISKGMGIEDMSLQKLYANFFGQRISKSAQLSNWEAENYTQAQKTYAATDAVACINLYKVMKPLWISGEYELK